MMGEDFDTPMPGADECQRCGFEIWGCICDPSRPYRKPTKAEIEAERARRLTRREIEPEAKVGAR